MLMSANLFAEHRPTKNHALAHATSPPRRWLTGCLLAACLAGHFVQRRRIIVFVGNSPLTAWSVQELHTHRKDGKPSLPEISCFQTCPGWCPVACKLAGCLLAGCLAGHFVQRRRITVSSQFTWFFFLSAIRPSRRGMCTAVLYFHQRDGKRP